MNNYKSQKWTREEMDNLIWQSKFDKIASFALSSIVVIGLLMAFSLELRAEEVTCNSVKYESTEKLCEKTQFLDEFSQIFNYYYQECSAELVEVKELQVAKNKLIIALRKKIKILERRARK